MAISARKLAANRANAKKSTGPRTVAGKARSSKNAVTHGLFCNDTVLPGEDAKLFEQFRHAVLLKLSPQDVVELLIVDRIVIAQWKLRRLNSVEASAHIGYAEEQIHGAREELDRRRIERFGTDAPDAAHAVQEQLLDQEERDLSVTHWIAVSAIRDEPYLERLSRYEQRLELSIHRNLRQLEKLRKQSQREDPDDDEPSRTRCPFVPREQHDVARNLARAATVIEEFEAGDGNEEIEATAADEPDEAGDAGKEYETRITANEAKPTAVVDETAFLEESRGSAKLSGPPDVDGTNGCTCRPPEVGREGLLNDQGQEPRHREC